MQKFKIGDIAIYNASWARARMVSRELRRHAFLNASDFLHSRVLILALPSSSIVFEDEKSRFMTNDVAYVVHHLNSGELLLLFHDEMQMLKKEKKKKR